MESNTEPSNNTGHDNIWDTWDDITGDNDSTGDSTTQIPSAQQQPLTQQPQTHPQLTQQHNQLQQQQPQSQQLQYSEVARQPRVAPTGAASGGRPQQPSAGRDGQAPRQAAPVHNVAHNIRPQQQQRQVPPTTPAADDGGGPWNVVNRRRGRRRVIGNITTHVTTLRGAPPPTREFFVSRVLIGDRETIKELIEANGIKVYNIDKMSHYHANFKSFKVKISVLDIDKILNENIWPNGIQCERWRNPRRSSSYSGNVNNVNNDQYDQQYNYHYNHGR